MTFDLDAVLPIAYIYRQPPSWLADKRVVEACTICIVFKCEVATLVL